MYTAFTTDGPIGHDPDLFGGKGNGLLQMASEGLNVPEALVITTTTWKHYQTHKELPLEVLLKVNAMADKYPDSMFSVRSGAPVSMPGMMDTVLNVGVTPKLDDTYPGAAKRFYSSWLNIVHGIEKDRIEELHNLVNARSLGDATRYRDLFIGVVQASEGVAVPSKRTEQLTACIEAVFKSWDTPRAKAYREMHGISEDMGTACVVQRMVMGTAEGFSGSGVMFSRDPATGEQKVRGEIALNAQGEEVVSGEVTPMNIEELIGKPYLDLVGLSNQLEKTYGDVQDIEFTFENGELYVLQTRTAKMSARARIITACAMAKVYENPTTRLKFVTERVTKAMVAKTRLPVVKTSDAPVTVGLAASPGAVTGKIVFRSTPLSQVDKTCILVADDTAPEDFPIMAKAGAIWTSNGGFTCHSAVVARGIGVPAVVGCEDMEVQTDVVMVGLSNFKEGDTVTIDGTTGYVFGGQKIVEQSGPPREIYEFLHMSILDGGHDIPEGTYYYDCGLGQNVVLPLELGNWTQIERQLSRLHTLSKKGKNVAIAFELFGLGEDMFDPSPEALFGELAEHYYPDIKGATVLYGVPSQMHAKVSDMLGVAFNENKVNVLDLLDVLGD